MKKPPYYIVYEDSDIIVVYKEYNVLTIHTDDVKTKNYNLYHYLSLYLRKKNEKIFIVHRLDYETSGLIVFAKNLEIKKKLQALFIERKVIRNYEAVIKEKVELGYSQRIINYVNDEKEVKEVKSGEGKECITNIVTVNYINIGTALKINIETGRRNQIRIALKSRGLTLLGDKRYANDISKRMYLNAYELILPLDELKENHFYVDPLWIKL